MKKLLVPAALLAAFTVGAQAQTMPWAKDFAAAQKLAASTKRLVMVDFYTDW
jgi:hypothetical protein